MNGWLNRLLLRRKFFMLALLAALPSALFILEAYQSDQIALRANSADDRARDWPSTPTWRASACGWCLAGG
ncbi:hypothetical protein [Duganella violaceipulchra]|nr:hypothetical protein [Duganella violaceicalia]